MLYAAYGSNINESQMKRRCPSAEIFDRGYIVGHKLVFCNVATVVEDENARTPVLIWQISEEDEKRLDRYEGYPYKYGKQKLPVQLNVTDDVVNIMAYTMNDSSHVKPPSAEYYSRIEDGYEQQGFDLAYLEDANDEAIDLYYGEELDEYAQFSLFDNFIYRDREPAYDKHDNDLKNAFIIGTAFAKYEDSLSFSDRERQRIIEAITFAHSQKGGKQSLANFADNYFEGLVEYQVKGGNTKDYIKQSEKLLYVAYGTNINLSEMRMRCPSSNPVCVSVLEDYELQSKGCADCVPSIGKKTPVLVWEIDRSDWEALDRYEGYPSFYGKENVAVSINGVKKQALMYRMTAEHNRLTPLSDGMYNRIKEGYKQNGMDCSALDAAQKAAKEAVRKESNKMTRGILR